MGLSMEQAVQGQLWCAMGLGALLFLPRQVILTHSIVPINHRGKRRRVPPVLTGVMAASVVVPCHHTHYAQPQHSAAQGCGSPRLAHWTPGPSAHNTITTPQHTKSVTTYGETLSSSTRDEAGPQPNP
ncbi:hypothetical protein EYF80_003116 [Liparis tanakae]|uniref:Uncharacterized protein n=1 Tax=Liparis tanakae TaxID=230148 RepID=A0A4Z2JAE8_9TELE|nr:hypothetical protein EYF80_003116 [Liparis tanakae]